MIHGVIELGEKSVHEVMVPRIGIRALEVNAPLDESARRHRPRRALAACRSTRTASTTSSASSTPRTCCRTSRATATAARRDRPARARAAARLRAGDARRVDELLHEMQRRQAPHRDRGGRVRRHRRAHHDRGPRRGDRGRDPGRVRRGGGPGRADRESTAGRVPARRAGEHGRPARPVRHPRRGGGGRGGVRHGGRLRHPPRRPHPASRRGGPVPRRDDARRGGRLAARDQGDRLTSAARRRERRPTGDGEAAGLDRGAVARSMPFTTRPPRAGRSDAQNARSRSAAASITCPG